MSGVGRRLRALSTRIGVEMYRRLDGRLANGSKDVTVLLLTAPGRRTGKPRSACVRYLETPDGYLVWGTGSGSRTEPDWFRNLRRAQTVDVQVRSRRFEAEQRVLEGAERDRVWSDVVLAKAPQVAKYERRAGRIIPVALLRPTSR